MSWPRFLFPAGLPQSIHCPSPKSYPLDLNASNLSIAGINGTGAIDSDAGTIAALKEKHKLKLPVKCTSGKYLLQWDDEKLKL